MSNAGRKFGAQQQVAAHVRVPVEQHHFDARLEGLAYVEFNAIFLEMGKIFKKYAY